MRYRPYRRPHWRRRGILGFPFMLFFIIFFFSHSGLGFLIGIGVMIILFAILRSVMASSFRSGSMNAGPFTQQPYQQPQQPYYQPYQEPYEPYQQGYQPSPVVNQDIRPQYPPQAQQPQYDEQPQAQYPQELPPIEQ